jgi:predicted ATPase
MSILHLENFAKIKNSDFDIKDITVFAGKPGTGKSYIMKMLYAWQISNKKLLSTIESIFGNTSQISDNFKIEYNNGSYQVKPNDILILKQHNINSGNAIFVETPLILEFYQFLDNNLNGKIPLHISSLVELLRKPSMYLAIDESQKEFINNFLNITNKIINGNIENNGNNFNYITNDDKNFNIINASSGIKSIGLLQYLVASKSLKKSDILFWEEPEVHLHPSWQLKMVDLFIELMNAGVKIVFSTHSPYMADYLNAKAIKEDFKNKVSFNVLSEKEEVVNNTILNDDNFTLLQGELMDSFEDILWQYL